MTDLEAALGCRFLDRDLLALALAHRSWAFESGGMPTNERLEFLGDAILGLVVTDQVFHLLPDAPEGRLAKLRSAAVSSASLAEIARGLGVGDAVKLGKGEEQSGGRDKDSILADTFEALIGALYLDQGIEEADRVVRRLFRRLLSDLATRNVSNDYKTALQELTAAELSSLPIYQVSDEGPDHEKEFTAVVLVDGRAAGRGKGRNKKEAEQRAARQALAQLTDVADEPGALATDGDRTDADRAVPDFNRDKVRVEKGSR